MGCVAKSRKGSGTSLTVSAVKGLNSRDRLFVWAMGLAFLVIVLFGVGVVIVSLERTPSSTISLRVLSVFAAMFSGWLGTMTGFLLGSSTKDS
jgi:hypothetical protein